MIMVFVDEAKRKYIKTGMVNPFCKTDNIVKWNKEIELIDCDTCGEQRDCPAYMKESRYPVDAGGAGQCLRLEEFRSPYAFRNGNGDVVVIPDEVVDRIADRVKYLLNSQK